MRPSREQASVPVNHKPVILVCKSRVTLLPGRTTALDNEDWMFVVLLGQSPKQF